MFTSRQVSGIRWFSLLLFGSGLAWGPGAHAAPPGGGGPSLSDLYRNAVASPVRTDDDRAADARRKPLAFLQFTKVQPGMKVLDIAAGAGYSTQLLALVAGNGGMVWAQGPKLRPGLQERLATHHQANIAPDERAYDDPVPPDARGLDLVTIIFNYHDIAYLPVDRAKMNQRLFDALKPGGHLVLMDHSATAGSGTSAAQTLHRIDEAVVKQELQQAGFRLEEEGDFDRNPADPRDVNVFKSAVPVDNFALRFVKP